MSIFSHGISVRRSTSDLLSPNFDPDRRFAGLQTLIWSFEPKVAPQGCPTGAERQVAAVLQCLHHLPALIDYFFYEIFISDLHHVWRIAAIADSEALILFTFRGPFISVSCCTSDVFIFQVCRSPPPSSPVPPPWMWLRAVVAQDLPSLLQRLDLVSAVFELPRSAPLAPPTPQLQHPLAVALRLRRTADRRVAGLAQMCGNLNATC